MTSFREDLFKLHPYCPSICSLKAMQCFLPYNCLYYSLPVFVIHYDAIVALQKCEFMVFFLSGMLVVNVTWRNKTYVGTLLDCTRHDWAPPR